MGSNMETFKVKQNSWHYKLVNDHIVDKYPLEVRERAMPKDFCSYWRRVVLESIKIGFVLIGAVSIMLIAVIGLGSFIYLAFIDVGLEAIIFIGILVAILATAFLIAMLPTILRNRKIKQLEQGIENRQSNIFVTKYNSWKGKFCPAIEYEKET